MRLASSLRIGKVREVEVDRGSGGELYKCVRAALIEVGNSVRLEELLDESSF